MAEEEEKTQHEPSLQELILNTSIQKYKLIPVTIRWMRELEKQEEYKGLSHTELLDTALKDILSGKVKIEDIEKLPVIKPVKQAGPLGKKNER